MQAAEQAWRQKNFPENISILERVSRLDPANVGILLQLGRVNGLCYNYAAAESWFERAIRVAPRKSEVLTAAGMHSRDFRNPDLSRRLFERASQQPDASPETFVGLAELYERLRRLNDAREQIDRALCLETRFRTRRVDSGAVGSTDRPGLRKQRTGSGRSCLGPIMRRRFAAGMSWGGYWIDRSATMRRWKHSWQQRLCFAAMPLPILPD